MATAWIKHPSLDGGERVEEVPESAVAQYQRSGWELADPPSEPVVDVASTGDVDVWIKHPDLDNSVLVPRSALPEHQRAGWVQTAPPPPPPLPEPDPGPDENPTKTTEAPADAGASAFQDVSPSRRRATTRGNE